MGTWIQRTRVNDAQQRYHVAGAAKREKNQEWLETFDISKPTSSDTPPRRATPPNPFQAVSVTGGQALTHIRL